MTDIEAEYIFYSLTFIRDIGKNTALHISASNNRLYVLKKVPEESFELYSALRGVNSPYIAPVLYVTRREGCAVIMREYIEGESLNNFTAGSSHPLNEAQIADIIKQLCEGLKELHARGIIHRDINLNNILLTPDGTVRIIDFGISRFYRAEQSRDTEILGTPGFAAPEQFGFAQTDNRSDIYSLGIVLSYLADGAVPYEIESKGRFARIIAKCISIDPSERYRDTDALYRALCRSDLDSKNRSGFIGAFPGLRSKNPFVFVLSLPAYVFALILLTEAYKAVAPNGAASLLLLAFSTFFSMFIPACCFHNILGLRDKFLPLRNGKPWCRVLGWMFWGLLSILCGLFMFGSALNGV